MSDLLAGRSVIVTGGGTGLGAACAAEAVACGAHVTICGRTESRLVAAAEQIAAGAVHGGSVTHVVADVTDEGDVERVVGHAVATGGRLDGVVANAGGAGALVPLHLQPTEDFVRVLHLNVVGTFLFLKHSVPHLLAAGGGSFVGMSSIAGGQTHRYFGAYTLSKAGIEQLVRNAADEYGDRGLRANAIRPGFIATELMDGVPRDSSVYASYVENTPMAPASETGVGEPEDIARLVRFLLSDEARWISGEVIGVDGGHHLRRGPDFSEFVPPE